MLFGKGIFIWKTYITNKALSIIEQVYIVDKKDFVIMVLNADSKTFIMHVAIRKQEVIPVHSKEHA